MPQPVDISLSADTTDGSADHAAPEDVVPGLLATIATLEARVAELERQLGLNSSNSSKPPSSDGPKKPRRTTSLRESSGRKTGGQKGHTGTTLRQSENPDAIVDHLPEACPNCGEGLAGADSVGHQARQVFDLPDPQPLRVTEHRAHECCCQKCGASAKAEFPDAVTGPVQYGPNITAMAAYLSASQLIPDDRIPQILHDLHRIVISAATISKASSKPCAMPIICAN